MNVELTKEQARALVYTATVGNMSMIDCNPDYTQERAKAAENGIQQLVAACNPGEYEPIQF